MVDTEKRLHSVNASPFSHAFSKRMVSVCLFLVLFVLSVSSALAIPIISKTALTPSVNSGETVQFLINISNPDNITIDYLVANDTPIGSGFCYSPGSANPVESAFVGGAYVSWDIVNLTAGSDYLIYANFSACAMNGTGNYTNTVLLLNASDEQIANASATVFINNTMGGGPIDFMPPTVTYAPNNPADNVRTDQTSVLFNATVSENASQCILSFRPTAGGTVDAHNVWIPSYAGNYVYQMDTSGNIIHNISMLSPWGVAVDQDGNVWVSSSGLNRTFKISSSGTIVGNYSAGANPVGIAIDYNGDAWVLNSGAGTVTKLDGNTGAVLGTFPAGSSLYTIAAAPNGDMWMVNQEPTNRIVRLNATGDVTLNISAVGWPMGVAVDSEGNPWVTLHNSGINQVVKLNGTSGSTLLSTEVQENPEGIAIDGFNNAWIAHSNGYVTKVYGNGTVAFSISGPASAHGVAVDADNNIWIGTDASVITKYYNNGTKIAYHNITGGMSSYGDMTGFALKTFVQQHVMAVTNADASTWASYTLTGLTSKTYTYQVNCTDMANNTNVSGSHTLVVDTLVLALSDAQPSGLQSTQDILVSAQHNKPSGLANCTLLISGPAAANYTAFSNSTHVYQNATFSDGSGYNATFVCNDTFGNSASISTMFGVDTEAPSISDVSINAGLTHTNIPSVLVAVTVSDNVSGIMGCSLSNDGLNFTMYPYNGSAYAWALSNGDALKTVFVQCIDNANHTSAVFNDTIMLDTQAPEITVVYPSPANGSDIIKALDGSFNLNVTTNEPVVNGSVHLVSMINNQSSDVDVMWPNTTEGWIWPFSYTNGWYQYYVIATDSANNTGTTTWYSFHLGDTTPPVVTVYAPADNTFSADNLGTFHFNFSVADNDLVLPGICVLFINGQMNQTLGSINTAFNHSFTVNSLAQGQYVWNIQCDDNYNMAGSANRTLTVDAVSPWTGTFAWSFGMDPSHNISTRNTNLTFNFTASDTATNITGCTYNVYVCNPGCGLDNSGTTSITHINGTHVYGSGTVNATLADDDQSTWHYEMAIGCSDAANNNNPGPNHRFSVDTSAPNATSVSVAGIPVPGIPFNVTSLWAEASASQNINYVLYQVINGTPVSIDNSLTTSVNPAFLINTNMSDAGSTLTYFITATDLFGHTASTDNVSVILFYDYNISTAGGNSNIDVAVDSQHRPHVVYERGGNLYYKKGLGNEMLIASGTSPSVSLDATGKPHVVFESGGVYYSYLNGSAWTTPYLVHTGSSPDSDVSANGTVHVVYLDNFNGYTDIGHGYGYGSNFTNDLLYDSSYWDSGGAYYNLNRPSIRVDSNGYFHTLVYRDDYYKPGHGYFVVYQTNAFGGFSSEVGHSASFSKNALSLDGSGMPHVIFNSGGLIYARPYPSWSEYSLGAGSSESIGSKDNTTFIAYVSGASTYYRSDSGDGFGSAMQYATGSNPIVALGSAYLAYLDASGNVKLKSDQYLTRPPQVMQESPADEVTQYGLASTFRCNATAFDSTQLTSLGVVILNATGGQYLVPQSMNLSALNWTSAAQNFVWESVIPGDYTWYCEAYDTEGNYGTSAVRSFQQAVRPPVVEQISPEDTSTVNGLNVTYHCNASALDGLTLETLGVYTFNETGDPMGAPLVMNLSSLNWTSTSDQTFYSDNMPDGNYTWYCEAYDSYGQSTSTGNQTYTLIADIFPPEIDTWIDDADNFASNASPNNIVRIAANITDLTGVNDSTVFVNFPWGSEAMQYNASDDLYHYDLTVTDGMIAALNQEFQPILYNVTARDVLNNPEGIYGNAFILYNFTKPMVIGDPCMRFGQETTDLAPEDDFNDVEFVVQIEANGSCDQFGNGMAWEGFEEVGRLEFVSLNFSDEGIGTLLAQLPSAIQVNITPPMSFGDSTIFVDTELFAQLNSGATIVLSNIPFGSLPAVIPDNVSRIVSNVNYTSTGVFNISAGGEAGGTCYSTVNCNSLSQVQCANYPIACTWMGVCNPTPMFSCSLIGAQENCTAVAGCAWNASMGGSSTNFLIPKGQLRFDVDGFSGYAATDNILPTITVLSPPSVTTRPVTVSFKVDGTGTAVSFINASFNDVELGVYDVSVPSTPVTTLNCTDNGDDTLTCTMPVNATAGNNTLFVDADDFGGNIGNDNFTIYVAFVDTQAPQITIVAPVSGTWYTSTNVSLNYLATDDYGVSSCWYSLNNGSNTPLASNTTFIASQSANTLTVSCNDTVGTTNSTSRSFQVDSIVPTLNSLLINSGQNYSSSASVTISINANDSTSGMSQCGLSNDGINYTYAAYAATRNWTLSSGDGVKTVYLRCNDSAGNFAGPINASVILDTTAPVATGFAVVPDPVNSSQNITVSANFTEANPVVAMLYVNGANVQNQSATTTPVFSHNMANVPVEANATIIVVLRDAVGFNGSTVPETVFVRDTSGPSAALVSPANGSATASPSVQFTFNATDNLNSTANCSLYIDGVLNRTWSNFTANALSNFGTATLSEGTHAWNVTCYDGSGNIGSSTTTNTFIIDLTAPAFIINALPGIVTSSNVSLAGNTADALLSSVVINNASATVTAPSYTLNLPLVEGANVLVGTAQDAVGNTNASLAIASVAEGTSFAVSTSGFTRVLRYVTTANTTMDHYIELRNIATDAASDFSFDNITNEGLITYDGVDYPFVMTSANTFRLSQGIGGAFAVVRDNTAPSSLTLSINAAAQATTSTAVALTFNATDLYGVSQCGFSNDGTNYSGWQTMNGTAAWTLISGDGVKTVFMKCNDTMGNMAAAINDTIVLDTSIPQFVVNSLPGVTSASSLLISGDTEDPYLASVTINNLSANVSGSTYTLALPLQEGANVLGGVAQDLAGHTNTTLSIMSVPEGSTFAVSVSGYTRVFRYQSTVDNATSQYVAISDLLSGINSEYSFDNVTGIGGITADGEDYQFIMTSSSTFSLVPLTAGALAVVKDTAAPTLISLAINNGALVTNSTSVALTFNAADNVTGTHQCGFSNDGTNYAGWQSMNGTAAWTLGTGDGVKTVFMKCNDTAGNMAIAINDTISLDLNAPNLTVNALAQYINASTTTISGTYNDFTTVQVFVNNTANSSYVQANTTGSTSGSYSATVNLSEGLNVITVIASDAVGRTSSLSVNTTRDTTAPVLSMDSIPSETAGSTRALSGTYTEANPVSAIVQKNGVTAANATYVGGNWSSSVTLSAGDNNLTVRMTDVIGFVGTATRSIFLDNAAPTVTIASLDGSNELSPVGNSSDAVIIINDNRNISSLWYVLDSDAPMVVNATVFQAMANVSVALSVPLGGSHSLVVYANDTVGNTGTVSATFYSTGPVNMSAFADDLGNSSSDINEVIIEQTNGTEVTNETLPVNQTFTLTMNVSVTENATATISLGNFSGMDANWNEQFTVTRNDSAVEDGIVYLGSTPQALITLNNVSGFLPQGSYNAFVQFDTSQIDFDYVYFCEWPTNCSEVAQCTSNAPPASLAQTPCYTTSNTSYTVYVPHFSSVVFSLDNIVGNLTVTSPDNSTVTGEGLLLAFDVTENVTANYTLDGGSQISLGSGLSFSTALNGNLSNGILSNGVHTISINVKDGSDNVDQTNYSFTVADSAAPVLTVTPSNSYSGTSDTYDLSISIVSSESAYANRTYNNGASTNTLNYATSASFSVTLVAGANNLTLAYKDAQGNNASLSKQYNYTKTTTTSSSSSGGGSSASGPALNYSTVSKAWQKVTAGTAVSFAIDNTAFAISNIAFTPTQDSSNAAITARRYGAKPSLLPALANATVFQYLEITGANTIFSTATVRLRVSKQWLTDNKVNASSIRLYHFKAGAWKSLTTIVANSDANYQYFDATTDSFSYFAVAGAAGSATAAAAPPTPEQKPSTPTTTPGSTPPTALVTGDEDTTDETDTGSKDVGLIWIIVILLVMAVMAYFLFARKPPRKTPITDEGKDHHKHMDTFLDNHVKK